MKKAVIITGVSSGLGRAIFDALFEKDIHIFAISRRFTAEQFELQNGRKNITLITCDLSQNEQVMQCADTLMKTLLDFKEVAYINNAFTIDPIGSIGEISADQIRDAIQTNSTSAIVLINAVCALKKASSLTFIDITSGAAKTPIEGWAVYCASKAMMKMFFSVLAKQSKTDPRISVHEFEPGVIDTNMQKKIRSAQFPSVRVFNILKESGKLRDPHEVAQELIQKYLGV